MSTERKRSYTSPKRDLQASATRRRIIAAAEQLFAAKGFAAVTMPQIARKAGVSLATAYIYFAGKALIVDALAEEIVAAPELSVEQVERERDPIRQVRAGARILRRLNERSWLVAEILRSAHGTDDHLKRVWLVWQQRHADAIARAIRAVKARGGLREGLRVRDAIDMLYALAGTDVYRALVRDRGWTPGRYERWLFTMSCTELLGVLPDKQAGDSPPSRPRLPPPFTSPPQAHALPRARSPRARRA